MELVCSSCGKFAKYRQQKMKLETIYDRSNIVCIEIYRVVRQSKPCTICKKLTAIDQTCCEIRVKHDSTEAILA